MELVLVVLLQICLDGQEPVVEGLAHEVLAEDSGDEDAVFFGDDFFGDAAFFFDEERGVTVCVASVRCFV